MSAGSRRRRGDGGFTVVELLVAMAVLLVGMLVVADLLDESGRLLHHSARRARDGFATLAGELLRNDLRGALAAPPAGPLWNRGPLRLATPDGPVVWRRRGRDLERATGATTRTLLRGVTGFRWRALREREGVAVEVEVTRELSGGWAGHAAPALPHGDRGQPELQRWVVAVGASGDGW